MRKETLKGLAIFTLMVALAILTSVVSANAQSRKGFVANIPFDFVVGDRNQPPRAVLVSPAGTSADFTDCY